MTQLHPVKIRPNSYKVVSGLHASASLVNALSSKLQLRVCAKQGAFIELPWRRGGPLKTVGEPRAARHRGDILPPQGPSRTSNTISRPGAPLASSPSSIPAQHRASDMRTR